jgi:hypothetical protein
MALQHRAVSGCQPTLFCVPLDCKVPLYAETCPLLPSKATATHGIPVQTTHTLNDCVMRLQGLVPWQLIMCTTQCKATVNFLIQATTNFLVQFLLATLVLNMHAL